MGPWDSRIERHFQKHLEVTQIVAREMRGKISDAATILVEALRTGGKILLFGNGGSMADAIHIEGELSGRFLMDREPLPVIALATGLSSITAIANDMGYDQIFSRQVRGLCRAEDAVVAISTSGNSRNVLNGVNAARERGAKVIGMAGGDGGALRDKVDCLLCVPSGEVPAIQENHILIGHILCGIVEAELFGQGK